MLSPCLEVASVRRRAVRHACEGWRLSSERERNDRGRSPAWVWKARIAFPTRKSCINFCCRDRSSHRPRRTYVELAKAHAYDRLGRHPTANLAHQEQTSAKSAKYAERICDMGPTRSDVRINAEERRVFAAARR